MYGKKIETDDDSMTRGTRHETAENWSEGTLDIDDRGIDDYSELIEEDLEADMSEFCTKLKYARNYYLSSGHLDGHSLDNDTEDMLWGDFSTYRDSKSYVVLKQEGGYEDGAIYGMKLPKRGNEKYRNEKRQKINRLLDGLDEKSMDMDFTDCDYTKALMVTFTYDTQFSTIRDAWSNIGVQFNRAMTSLRQRYGKISVFRTFESYENGYPHVHALLLFHEHEFDTFEHIDGSVRIDSKDEFADYCNWHSHIDVEGVKNIGKSINYLAKYFTKDTISMSESAKERHKAKLTLSLSWLFRKRSFAVSGDFREALYDLIHSKSNSNTIDDMYYLFRWVEDVNFKFMCTANADFLGIERYENYVRLDDSIESKITA